MRNSSINSLITVAAFTVGGWIGLLALEKPQTATPIATADHRIAAASIPKVKAISGDKVIPSTAFDHQSAALDALADPLTTRSELLRRCEDPFAAAIILPFLTDTDPSAVVEFLKALHPDRARSFAEATASVFERWAARDPDAAISSASTLSLNFRPFAATGILDGIFRAEPESDACLNASLALLKMLPAPDGFPPPEWILWLAGKPTKAIKALDALPDSNLRTILAESFAKSSPADAFAWTKTVADPIHRNRLARRTILSLAEHDPRAAIELWEVLPDQLAKSMMTASLAKRFASKDPAQAMSWIEKSSFSSAFRRHWAQQEVYAEWIVNDFEAATTHALSQQSPREQVSHVRAIAEAIFGKSSDPAQTRQFLEMVGNDQQLLHAALGKTHAWLTRDVTGAISYAETMKPDHLPPRFLYEIADTWSREDPEAYAQWASSAFLSEADQQPTSLGAAKFLQSRTEAGLTYPMVNAIRSKPAEAIATIMEHPDLLPAASYNRVAANYFTTDFDNAAEWLESFAATTPDRDRIISALNGLGAVVPNLSPEQQASARAIHAQLSAVFDQ